MQFYSLKNTGEYMKLHHATGVDGIEVVLWELLAADVEGVEGIRLKCKKIARLREEVVSDEKLYTH